MKFYRMVGHNPGTNRLDFECPRRKVKIVRGQRSKSFFVINSVQNSRRVSRQKLKRRLFNSLNISKRDYDSSADSFKDR